MGESLAWQRLGELAAYRGDHATAQEHCHRSLQLARESSMADHLIVRIYATLALNALEQGDPQAAAKAVEDSEEAAKQYGVCQTCSALMYPVAAEAYSALGNLEQAEQHARASGEVAANWESGAWLAMAELARGAVDRMSEDSHEALSCFAAAAEGFQRINQPFEAARCLFLSGTIYMEHGAMQEARASLEKSLGIFQELGAKRGEARVREALARLSEV